MEPVSTDVYITREKMVFGEYFNGSLEQYCKVMKHIITIIFNCNTVLGLFHPKNIMMFRPSKNLKYLAFGNALEYEHAFTPNKHLRVLIINGQYFHKVISSKYLLSLTTATAVWDDQFIELSKGVKCLRFIGWIPYIILPKYLACLTFCPVSSQNVVLEHWLVQVNIVTDQGDQGIYDNVPNGIGRLSVGRTLNCQIYNLPNDKTFSNVKYQECKCTYKHVMCSYGFRAVSKKK